MDNLIELFTLIRSFIFSSNLRRVKITSWAKVPVVSIKEKVKDIFPCFYPCLNLITEF